jgi:hypothetical protein
MIGLFGCELVMRPDPEAEARMRSKWEFRDGSKVHPPDRVSKELLELARPLVFAELGRAGGRARAMPGPPSRDRTSPEPPPWRDGGPIGRHEGCRPPVTASGWSIEGEALPEREYERPEMEP